MTLIRAMRLLANSESLDSLSDKIGIAPSHLSVIERYGHNRKVGSALKRRIERHYGLPFDVLIEPVDSDAIVTLIRQQVSAKVGRLGALPRAA